MHKNFWLCVLALQKTKLRQRYMVGLEKLRSSGEQVMRGPSCSVLHMQAVN